MKISNIEFIGSFKQYKQAPDDHRPAYAFIGRSNVGKSSLINLLTGRTNTARVSSNPGKTQSLNYFLVDENWYLVDLPGYGYAKVSQKEREAWQKMIRQYLSLKENLVCTFVLIDSRIPPQELDISFINWLGEAGIPFVLVFTKVDKLKGSERGKQIRKISSAILEYWEELPEQFECSSVTGEGREELLNFIQQVNERYQQQIK